MQFEAAHEAVKSTGAKRIISTIRTAERLDASRRLETLGDSDYLILNPIFQGIPTNLQP